MNEIKFRGKNAHTRKWIYGYFVNHDNYPQIWVLDKYGLGSYPQPIDFETLGQFIGVNDKIDNEIYFNDILDYKDCAKFVVEWTNEGGMVGFVLKCIEGLWKDAYWDIAEIIGQKDAFKIIGSICD